MQYNVNASHESQWLIQWMGRAYCMYIIGSSHSFSAIVFYIHCWVWATIYSSKMWSLGLGFILTSEVFRSLPQKVFWKSMDADPLTLKCESYWSTTIFKLRQRSDQLRPCMKKHPLIHLNEAILTAQRALAKQCMVVQQKLWFNRSKYDTKWRAEAANQ